MGCLQSICFTSNGFRKRGKKSKRLRDRSARRGFRYYTLVEKARRRNLLTEKSYKDVQSNVNRKRYSEEGKKRRPI